MEYNYGLGDTILNYKDYPDPPYKVITIDFSYGMDHYTVYYPLGQRYREDKLLERFDEIYQCHKCHDYYGRISDWEYIKDPIERKKQAEVDRILNARHMFGQEEWKLHRKAFQTFNKYMDELAAVHSGVDPNSPESFFIDNNVVKHRSKIMCETPAKIKNYLYLYTLRHQISSKLISDYGIEFDNNKTSFIEEFLKKPSLKNRYQFDPIYGVMGDDDVLIEDMTPLELFISLIFRYERPDGSGENKPIITAASAGQSNLRDYGYVVDNDRTGNKNYIKMIEVGDGGGPDTRVISKIARAKWDAQSLQYKVGESFQEIARILDGINTKTIHEARSDAMEQDYKLIKEKFSLIDAALKQKSKF